MKIYIYHFCGWGPRNQKGRRRGEKKERGKGREREKEERPTVSTHPSGSRLRLYLFGSNFAPGEKGKGNKEKVGRL